MDSRLARSYIHHGVKINQFLKPGVLPQRISFLQKSTDESKEEGIKKETFPEGPPVDLKKSALEAVDRIKLKATDLLSQFKAQQLGTANVNHKWYSEQLGFMMRKYENFIGLTAVKSCQKAVIEQERIFISFQDKRRDVQSEITSVQNKLKTLKRELDLTSRADDRYLELITEEHTAIKLEAALLDQLSEVEKQERTQFTLLSNYVRDSHEQERIQAEKTKYWSVIGSIIGTVLGVTGTTLNNYFRMKEMKKIAMAKSGYIDSDFIVNRIDDNFQKLRSDCNELLDHKSSSLQKPPEIHIPPKDYYVSDVKKTIDISLNSFSDKLSRSFQTDLNRLELKKEFNAVGSLFVDMSAKIDETKKDLSKLEDKVTDLRSLLVGANRMASKSSVSNSQIQKSTITSNKDYQMLSNVAISCLIVIAIFFLQK